MSRPTVEAFGHLGSTTLVNAEEGLVRGASITELIARLFAGTIDVSGHGRVRLDTVYRRSGD